MTFFYRFLFSASIWFFRLTNIYRPSRLFDMIGSRAYKRTEYFWFTNTYKSKLLLAPHFHIDRNIILFGCYDRQLHLMLNNRCKQAMVCFDIGSNLGEVTLHMGMLVGQSGMVFGIDPNPFAFQRLKGHVKANGLETVIECLPVAISNYNGELELLFPDETADNQGLGSIVNIHQRGATRTQTVKTFTIDEIVKQYSLSKVDLIKIDTQGSEPLILEGAMNTIRKSRPDIILEISPDDLTFLKMTGVDLIRNIERYGYKIFEFRNGVLTKEITSDSIPDDYVNENVYCTAGNY